MDAAIDCDLVIEMVPAIGEFVPHGAPLFRIWGKYQREGREISQCVMLADERTPYQDPMFGFRQLVDIAERALSPGVNDPSTAVQALDQLHDLLRMLATRRFPPSRCAGSEGRVRLLLPRPEFADYVRLSFEEIRCYGAGAIQVVRKMRRMLQDLHSIALPEHKACVEHELALLAAAVAHARPELGH